MDFAQQVEKTHPEGLNSPPVCDSSAVMAAYDPREKVASFMDGNLAERRAGLVSTRSYINSNRLHLFKYRHLDWNDPQTKEKARSLIVKNRIWAASPDSLNDPHDLGFSIVYSDDKRIRRQWLERYAEQLSRLPPAHRQRAEWQILHGTFTPEMLNEAKQAIDQGMGVFCASSSPRSSALWAYYGDSHKGFCIQYATYNDPLFLIARAVQYTDEYPVVSLPVDSADIKEYYLRKSTDWTHEGEWRIVLPLNKCFVQLQPSSVSGVIFGVKAEAKTIETVLGFQKEREELGMPPFKLYQAYLPPSKYGIRIAGF